MGNKAAVRSKKPQGVLVAPLVIQDATSGVTVANATVPIDKTDPSSIASLSNIAAKASSAQSLITGDGAAGVNSGNKNLVIDVFSKIAPKAHASLLKENKEYAALYAKGATMNDPSAVYQLI